LPLAIVTLYKRRVLSRFAPALLLLLWSGVKASAQEAHPRFTGAITCMSSSCHGGGTGKNQGLIFAKLDVHRGALAILSSSRSQRIAEALQLPSAAQSQRCVVCHSPQQTVPANRFVKPGTPDLAISCETCHGPAEPWLRAHTRPDFTHELRVAEGLRDLSTPYQRANACVACHLNLEPEIRRAGHPEMFFELDGQLASQPPHWKENDPWHGPRAWLTGQAVALRELSWKLGSHPDAELNLRWRALIWLLQRADAGGKLAPTMSYSAMQQAADQLAQSASAQPWSREDGAVAPQLRGPGRRFQEVPGRPEGTSATGGSPGPCSGPALAVTQNPEPELDL
jgi:hypothetical protein